MTRGDGSTYDTDAHVEWGYVIDDWPVPDVTSFIVVENELTARNITTDTVRPIALARRFVSRVEVIT